MIEIDLSGVFGWEILSSEIKETLKNANGQDINTNISSVGGSAFEGIEIYNAFRDYKRKFPDAQLVLNYKGIVASMAANLGLNPAFDLITTEDNVAHMVHNAWMCSCGDHNDLRKDADFLEGVNGPFIDAAVQKTGQGKKQVKAMFDEETWLFGQQIVDAGFADEIIKTENQEIDESQAKASMASDKKRFEKHSFSSKIESSKDIAASLKPKEQNANIDTKKQENNMALDEKEKEEIQATATATANERVSSIMALKEKYKASLKEKPGVLALIVDIIDKAIMDPKAEKAEVLTDIVTALSSGNVQAALDSPDGTPQGGTDTPSGENGKTPEVKSESF